LVRIGPGTPSMAGTVAARSLDIAGGTLDEISLGQVGSYLDALAAHRHRFRSGTRLGAGGLAAQLTVGALASGLGVEADPSVRDRGAGLAESLFAEHRCGCRVEIEEPDLAALPDELCPPPIGRLTSGEGLRVGDVELLTPAVAERWSTSFAGRLV